MKIHTINAEYKKLGRVASEAARLIMGKDSPNFSRNIIPKVKVVIENASKLNISEKKLTMSTHERYSGYPGGRKVLKASEVIAKKGYKELVRKAVYGMLPTNTLRPKMIKCLEVKE